MKKENQEGRKKGKKAKQEESKKYIKKERHNGRK